MRRTVLHRLHVHDERGHATRPSRVLLVNDLCKWVPSADDSTPENGGYNQCRTGCCMLRPKELEDQERVVLLSPAWLMIEAEQREAGFPARTLGQPDHYPCSQQ